jgi:hypothetical protein
MYLAYLRFNVQYFFDHLGVRVRLRKGEVHSVIIMLKIYFKCEGIVVELPLLFEGTVCIAFFILLIFLV